MDIKLTAREAEVLEVLWRRGPCTVSEVREDLADDLAYTTVLTVLRTLETKTYVRHSSAGRAHRYSASITREKAQRSAAKALIHKLFKGSTELLLTHLVTDQKLTDAEAERIKQLLDQKSGNKGKA
jgi:BlaI family transcriptional regulator, penicillinase repressor